MAYSRATSLLTAVLLFPLAASLADSCNNDVTATSMAENSITSLLQVDLALSDETSAEERRFSEFPEEADWEADRDTKDYRPDIRAWLDKNPDLSSAFVNTLPRYTEAEASQVWLSLNRTVSRSEGSAFHKELTKEWMDRLFQGGPGILTNRSNFDNLSTLMSEEGMLQRIGDLQRLKQYVPSCIDAHYQVYPYLAMNLTSAVNRSESFIKKEGTLRFMMFTGVNDLKDPPVEDQMVVSERIEDDPLFLPLPAYAMPEKTGHNIFFINAAGSATNMHNHQAVWHFGTVGRKVWWVLDPKYTGGETDAITYGPENLGIVPNACAYLSTETPPKGTTMFIQYPGETVLVPDFYWHATCALDEYVSGTGGYLYDIFSSRAGDIPGQGRTNA